MKILFENEPFSVDEWWAGEVTVDIGGEEEYREKYYPFTLFVSNDNGVLEVTWTEETPENNEELEKEIIDKFLSL